MRHYHGERCHLNGAVVCCQGADQVRRVGPGGTASDIPRILHAALGLPIRVIDGYKGTADIRLVTEAVNWREAVLGWESLKTTWRKGIDSGEVNVVVQNMPKKQPELPGVPLLGDYVKTDEARKLIKYGIQDTAVITRPNFLSPGTPKNRVQLLRKAFADTLKDPELLAERKRLTLISILSQARKLKQLFRDCTKSSPLSSRV